MTGQYHQGLSGPITGTCSVANAPIGQLSTKTAIEIRMRFMDFIKVFNI
jgi:hypothetical protein